MLTTPVPIDMRFEKHVVTSMHIARSNTAAAHVFREIQYDATTHVEFLWCRWGMDITCYITYCTSHSPQSVIRRNSFAY